LFASCFQFFPLFSSPFVCFLSSNYSFPLPFSPLPGRVNNEIFRKKKNFSQLNFSFLFLLPSLSFLPSFYPFFLSVKNLKQNFLLFFLPFPFLKKTSSSQLPLSFLLPSFLSFSLVFSFPTFFFSSPNSYSLAPFHSSFAQMGNASKKKTKKIPSKEKFLKIKTKIIQSSKFNQIHRLVASSEVFPRKYPIGAWALLKKFKYKIT